MSQARSGRDRVDELLARQRSTRQGIAGRLSIGHPASGVHVEVGVPGLLPPRLAVGDEREQGGSVVGRQEVERAAHGPRLDQPAIGQGPVDLAGARRPTTDPDAELGGRRDLGLDPAEAPDDLDGGAAADRFEQLRAASASRAPAANVTRTGTETAYRGRRLAGPPRKEFT